MGATSSKAASSKAATSQMKFVPKDGATPRASVPPKVGVPVKAAMPKSMMTLATLRAGVLMISAGVKKCLIIGSTERKTSEGYCGAALGFHPGLHGCCVIAAAD
jgi:hypothetical protein